MARGGKRQGAGRPKGSRNAKTAAIAQRAAEEGITPLEVMLDNMRFFHAEATRLAAKLDLPDDVDLADAAEALKAITGARNAAQECAKDAAPYMHPRLAAIEHGGKDGGPILVRIGGDEAEF